MTVNKSKGSHPTIHVKAEEGIGQLEKEIKKIK